MAYEFEPSHVQVVAELLDRITTSGDGLMDSWQRLWFDEEYKLLNEDLRAEMDFLFTYELQEDFGTAGEIRLVESGPSLTATRPMSDTPAGAWELWSEIDSVVKNSIIRAHIADVLLTARITTKPEHASSAIALYLATADLGEVSPQQAALSLARANTIARSREMAEELSVRTAMHDWLDTLENNPEKSSQAMTLLAALSVPPRGGVFTPGEREAVRTRLFTLGEFSSMHIDELGKTLVRLAENATELEIARRWHVKRYLTFAESANQGMQKMHHAQTAADLATVYGLSDLRDTAVLIMQSVDHDTMGWETAAIDVPISKNVFRAHLRRYRHARNWEHALMIFLAGSSPSGDHSANIKTAEHAASGSIRALFSQTAYGKHGLPERANADFMEEEISRTEIITLGMSGILLALELQHIQNRFPQPSADQIADLMVDRFSAEPTLSKYFSESLALHWAGEFSNSARLSIPLIESAARGLLLTLDEPLYRTQRGKIPGRFPAMGFYVDALSQRDLDSDWARALRITLLSPGMNLRNLAAHGFSMDFSDNQSALLLRLAGLFCAMPIGMDQSGLESPPNVARRRLRRRLGWVWS